MTLALVFDLILAVLLSATIFMSYRFSRKIDAFKQGEGNLHNLIAQLNVATERAQAAVTALGASLKEADAKMGERIGRGRALADELDIIIGSGERLANQLASELNPANLAAQSRNSAGQPPRSVKSAPVVADEDTQMLTKILQGLR